jgi:hypothetical protein
VDLKRRGHGGSRARVIINRQQEEEMMYVCPSPRMCPILSFIGIVIGFVVLGRILTRNICSKNMDRRHQKMALIILVPSDEYLLE